MRPTLHTADVLAYAAAYTGEPYHALLCDPPYHLTSGNASFDFATLPGNRGHFTNANGRGHQSKGFMGKTWDGGDLAFRAETWAAFWPLLHPGAFGMAFCGSRGIHRMMVAIEDAGYIIHPVIGWCYGSGFPKASRIDTQIDAAAGVERETLGVSPNNRPNSASHAAVVLGNGKGMHDGRTIEMTAPATDLARAWAGHRYGLQALKPALEFIVVFQKPYQGRPVDSMVATGAGALNIDGARVGTQGSDDLFRIRTSTETGSVVSMNKSVVVQNDPHAAGRWPANLVLSHAPECEGIPVIDYSDPDDHHARTIWTCVPGCAVAALGAQSGDQVSGIAVRHRSGGNTFGGNNPKPVMDDLGYGDTGTAARFFFAADYAAERLEAADPLFYCAKSSTAEREAGLSGRQKQTAGILVGRNADARPNHAGLNGDQSFTADRANIHPTCKPIALARHLATLLLPPARYAPRRLFVPFAGVASECIGAMQAGWDHVDGVELESEHVEIGQARIAWWAEQGVQLTLFDDSL